MPTKNLHLVNFKQLKLEQLQQHINDALENGTAFLAMLNDEPTAKNSQQAFDDITAFEHVNIALDRSWGLLSHLNNVVSNDEIRALHHEMLPNVSEYGTKVGQNLALFSRYRQVIDDTAFFKQLEPARKRALQLALQGFELSGVALDDVKKAEFAKLANELSTLSAKFSDNLLDATQSYFLPLLDNQLKGLPQSALALLKDAGERYREKTGKTTPTQYVATLDMPVYLAVMKYIPMTELCVKPYTKPMSLVRPNTANNRNLTMPKL